FPTRRSSDLSALTRQRLPHEPAEKPLAAVVAKHHSRSCGDSATTAIGPASGAVVGQVRHEFHHGPPPTEVEAAGSIRECGRGGLSPWDVWHAGNRRRVDIPVVPKPRRCATRPRSGCSRPWTTCGRRSRSRCWASTDNGAEFINGHLLAYCEQEEITFTRFRPGNKNDGAYVEQ